MIKEGKAAPDFTLRDAGGNEVGLADFRGRRVALYFYPKDDTPGCTKQACSLRDSAPELNGRGIEVIGVSPDSEQSHREVADKYGLPFTLLSDPGHEVADLYGVWGERVNYAGRRVVGILRTTFLIGEDGVVERVLDEIDVEAHAGEVLAAFGG